MTTLRVTRALVYDEAALLSSGWSKEAIDSHTVPYPAKWTDGANYWAEEAVRHAHKIQRLEDAARAAQRHLSIYRWVAIVGWLIAVALLTLQPTYASAATLPAGSLACDNALAYEAQMLTFSDATLVADPGCVFTDRDLVVHPVQGNEVFVEEIGFSIWADVEVLQ